MDLSWTQLAISVHHIFGRDSPTLETPQRTEWTTTARMPIVYPIGCPSADPIELYTLIRNTGWPAVLLFITVNVIDLEQLDLIRHAEAVVGPATSQARQNRAALHDRPRC
jgi:hypothetical protein